MRQPARNKKNSTNKQSSGVRTITKIFLLLLVLAAIKLTVFGAIGVEKLTQSVGEVVVETVAPVAGVEVAQAQTEAMAQDNGEPAEDAVMDEKPEGMDESDWQVLKRREEELAAKERSLLELEAQLDSQLVEIEKRNEQLRKLLADVESVKEERMQKLIKAYANMKAKSAAAVLETMEQGLAVKILSGLGGRQAGEILGFIETRKAAILSEALTNLRAPFEQ